VLKAPELLPLFYVFVNCDIAVDGEICEAFESAGSKPIDLMPIDFRALANPYHHAGIVRREVTASPQFHSTSFQITSLIADARTEHLTFSL